MPVLLFFFLNSIRTKRDCPDPHSFSLPGACILPPSWPEVANLWGRSRPLPCPAGSPHSSFKGWPTGGEASSPNTVPTCHPQREVKAQVPGTHDLQMLCDSVFQPGPADPLDATELCQRTPCGEDGWRQARAESAAVPPFSLPPEQLCFYLLPTKVSLSNFVLKKNFKPPF